MPNPIDGKLDSGSLPPDTEAAFWKKVEEAHKFCHAAGWHHQGDTRVTFASGGMMELAEALAIYAEQITTERDHWRKLAMEAINLQPNPPRIITVVKK